MHDGIGEIIVADDVEPFRMNFRMRTGSQSDLIACPQKRPVLAENVGLGHSLADAEPIRFGDPMSFGFEQCRREHDAGCMQELCRRMRKQNAASLEKTVLCLHAKETVIIIRPPGKRPVDACICIYLQEKRCRMPQVQFQHPMNDRPAVLRSIKPFSGYKFHVECARECGEHGIVVSIREKDDARVRVMTPETFKCPRRKVRVAVRLQVERK